jgi:hypothetical protein
MSFAWRDRAVFGEACDMEVVHERVGLGRLLGHCGDRSLEDVALAVQNCGIVVLAGTAVLGTPY